MNRQNQHDKILSLALGGILTAVVIVLQLFASAVKFGPFQVSLVLMPIVIGAAMCGKGVSAWLGFVFGMVVLLNGDAAAFLAINAPGTVVTVLVKGTLCAFAAGLVYELVCRKNKTVAVMLSAVAAPVVNTGTFLIGCRLFFFETIKQWASGAGFENPVMYMFVGLVGLNFVFETALNIVLCPVIVRIINASKTRHSRK